MSEAQVVTQGLPVLEAGKRNPEDQELWYAEWAKFVISNPARENWATMEERLRTRPVYEPISK